MSTVSITKFGDGSALGSLSLTAELVMATNGSKKSAKDLSHIFRTYNVSASLEEEYLSNLCILGLLTQVGRIFKTTKKGEGFLEDYKRLQSELDS
jgi:predicted transcriptional regulator